MGALAAVAALALVPASAPAADGASVYEFKLPNKAAADKLIKLGFDLGDGLDQSQPAFVKATIVATDAEKAQLEAMGYPAVNTIQTPADVAALRAERAATLKAERAAEAALAGGAGNGKARRAAGTVRAQRAEYWTNAGGLWLSIEGTTTNAHYTCSVTNGRERCTYDGDPLTAGWYDADGNQIGSIQMTDKPDPDISPDAYLCHVAIVRLGSADTTPPASVRIAAPNGDVATLATRKWVGNDGTTHPTGFLQDFNTHYVDPQEGYQRITDLAREFDDIAQVYELPNKTNGYQRKAQTIIGTEALYTGAVSNSNTPLSADEAARAVVVTSKAWGHEGGNDIAIRLVDPGAPDEPLFVGVNGSMIRVNLATDGSGAITSTAKDVVDALNADERASALVTATTFRGNAGAGVVAPQSTTSRLDDYLNAPDSYPRGPQTVKMLRIGKHRDGSKTGVFIYCQEHAREWATPLVCLETAERLLRNYATDEETKTLVDNLDIFIIPTINADGAAYSFYDNNTQRRNMVNYCASDPTGPNDPIARNRWGVDLNRNFSVGSFFDGYVGGSGSCTSDTFSGPFELSEPEVKNEAWVQSTFPNIKFAMNVHSSGGYFMWPPGAYTPERVTLPYPPYGTLNYFDQTAAKVLDRIYTYRHTAVLPQQTGPVADVLYSAAGNSADEAYYSHGIIGYDFEIGASKVLANGSSVGTGFQPPFSTPDTCGGTGSCNENLVNEGHDEGMEFANGNYALLESALEYQNDNQAPTATASGDAVANVPQLVRFTTDEAAGIFYTLDGSTPTTSSTEWKPNRPRELPDPIEITDDATLKWIAVDFKGNTSPVQSKTFLIDTVKPTVTLTGFDEGQLITQGRLVTVTYSCADEEGGSGIESCTGTGASGGLLDTSTPGTFTYTVTATDKAGNVTTVSRGYTVIPATNVNGEVGGTVPATLALTLGGPASFGEFTPGVTRTYEASTTANVISTAGDATLSVSDPGHLANGAFALPEPLQVAFSKSSWSAPVTNEAVTISFTQLVKANDPLRTGAYSRTLTFTLSTTTP